MKNSNELNLTRLSFQGRTLSRRDFLRSAAMIATSGAVGIGVNACKDKDPDPTPPDKPKPVIHEIASIDDLKNKKDLAINDAKDTMKVVTVKFTRNIGVKKSDLAELAALGVLKGNDKISLDFNYKYVVPSEDSVEIKHADWSEKWASVPLSSNTSVTPNIYFVSTDDFEKFAPYAGAFKKKYEEADIAVTAQDAEKKIEDVIATVTNGGSATVSFQDVTVTDNIIEALEKLVAVMAAAGMQISGLRSTYADGTGGITFTSDSTIFLNKTFTVSTALTKLIAPKENPIVKYKDNKFNSGNMLHLNVKND